MFSLFSKNSIKEARREVVSARNEKDEVEFLSGIFEGKSTGTPIGFTIYNNDQKSKDYSHLKNTYRPSHADFTYEKNTALSRRRKILCKRNSL